MLTVKIVNFKAVAIASFSEAETFWKEHKTNITLEGDGYVNRNDWKSWDEVAVVATDLTESLGEKYIPIDKGRHVSPRFDVIKAPQVGDDVSMAFNGDYYPCGKIKSISATLSMITTTEGKRFFRQGKSGTWRYQGWTLIPGHISQFNQEF
jgi:hypothetical protein